MNTTDKLTELKNLLAGNRVIIALSGGVDSSVMAKLALDLLGYDQVLAVTASSEIMATTELDSAREMARIIGIKHTMLSTSSLEDPNLVANPIDRCYHCKHHLYQLLLDYAG
ncbi:MAG: 7-cyano-7-deazaguanine synthase, partial [Methylocystaceae bacterium]